MSLGEIAAENKVGALVLKWFVEHSMRARCLRRGDYMGANECERALELIEMRLIAMGELPPKRPH